jgi:hypothetical protein
MNQPRPTEARAFNLCQYIPCICARTFITFTAVGSFAMLLMMLLMMLLLLLIMMMIRIMTNAVTITNKTSNNNHTDVTKRRAHDNQVPSCVCDEVWHARCAFVGARVQVISD